MTAVAQAHLNELKRAAASHERQRIILWLLEQVKTETGPVEKALFEAVRAIQQGEHLLPDVCLTPGCLHPPSVGKLCSCCALERELLLGVIS